MPLSHSAVTTRGTIKQPFAVIVDRLDKVNSISIFVLRSNIIYCIKKTISMHLLNQARIKETGITTLSKNRIKLRSIRTNAKNEGTTYPTFRGDAFPVVFLKILLLAHFAIGPMTVNTLLT